MVRDLFADALLLVDGAKAQLEEYQTAERLWLEDPKIKKAVIEVDPKTGDQLLKVRIDEIPLKLRQLAFRIINELKLALDQATTAALTAVLKAPPDWNVYFPFAGNPTDLKRNRLRRFPEALHATFEKFEPYPSGQGYSTGDDYLVSLNRLAREKHRSVIQPIARVEEIHFNEIDLRAGRLRAGLAWEFSKGELPIALLTEHGKAKLNFNLPIYIGFHDAGGLSRLNVGAVLSHWVADTGNIVRTILADTEILLS